MLIVISPAKTLDFETSPITKDHTQAEFLKDSRQLVSELKKLAPHEVSSLMKISDKLGTLNYVRFNDWKTPFTLNNAKQALLAFKGDVYTGLDAETFSKQDLKFAQTAPTNIVRALWCVAAAGFDPGLSVGNGDEV